MDIQKATAILKQVVDQAVFIGMFKKTEDVLTVHDAMRVYTQHNEDLQGRIKELTYKIRELEGKDS